MTPEIFSHLWQDYITLNPSAKKIHDLLENEGETIINDHVAFRTYRSKRFGIEALAQPFLALGYRENGEYHFEEKKLFAKHYEPKDPKMPKVFISELLVDEFSSELQSTVNSLLNQVQEGFEKKEDFIYHGRPWSLSYSNYKALLKESEYAAWLSAFGFRANHFTVLVNELKTYDTLEKLNAFIESHGFALNDSGGKIKGSPDVLLEQSSTKAKSVPVDFTDGTYDIPACYYEFAKRYPDSNGELYQGFVAASADKIFESTDQKP